MLKIDVENLCEDLDKLLKDICEFLSDEVNNKNLTEKQRLFASKLIERSKKQLQQISTVLSIPEADDYVDMSPQTAADNDSTYEDAEIIKCPPPIGEKESCPYEDLPAVRIDDCEKYGFLDRKGKIFFIGHNKKLYAGIKNNWLLIYGSRKDTKPIECLNLSYFTAKSIDAAKARAFELTCTKTQKTYQFVAITTKDMMQWLACINKNTSTKDVDHNTPTTEEEISPYEPVVKKQENIKIDKRWKNVTKPLPPLPAENTNKNQNAPLPQVSSDTDQLANDTEEEEDPTYSELDYYKTQQMKNIKENVKRPAPKLNEIKTESQESNSIDEPDPVYDLPERSPNSPEKPNVVKPKNYYNTNNIRPHPRLNEIRTESQLTDSFSEVEEEIYDIIEKSPIPKDENAPQNQNTNAYRQNPQLTEVERASQLTVNSFSDIEEDLTYDLPERLSPNKPLPQLPKYPPAHISPAIPQQNFEEPEDEYCNLVMKDDVNKDDEGEDIEYDYLCPQPDPVSNKKIAATTNMKQKMGKFQIAPPLKPKPPSRKKK